jgi:DNA-binding GntR family transcriptional regulator
MLMSIVEQIKNAIESGALPAGSTVGQEQLAEQLGVSRQPIRQALPLLIAEGWIQSLPNRRLLVRQLTVAEVDEIFQIRKLLEPAALAQSVPRITPAIMRRVKFALEEYADAHTPAELEAADVALHQALYSGCENASLLRLIEQMRRSLKRVYELKPMGSTLRRNAIAEHRRLTALCEQRDAQGAAALLLAHLDSAHAELRKSLSTAARKA